MLDHRIDTFLTLCRTGSYTKTAELLHMTQPAVTQHIRYLEGLFGAKLCLFQNRSFSLTPKGQLLLDFATTAKSDVQTFAALLKKEDDAPALRFGATLTIGEYTLAPILAKYLSNFPAAKLFMQMGNTDVLLAALREWKLDFAFIEGHFDKSKYDVSLFKSVPFIAVCAGDDPRQAHEWTLEELTDQHIMLREPGSGTRGIFEQILREQNMTLDNFTRLTEIGSLNVIKYLVRQHRAITFIYKDAVTQELSDGTLAPLQLAGTPVFRDFSFVTLKGSRFTEHHRHFLDFCLRAIAPA